MDYMKAVYLIALAILGNGVYLLVQGKIMEGFGTMMFAVIGVVFLLIYQYTEHDAEVKRKSHKLPRTNSSRRPRA